MARRIMSVRTHPKHPAEVAQRQGRTHACTPVQQATGAGARLQPGTCVCRTRSGAATKHALPRSRGDQGLHVQAQRWLLQVMGCPSI